MEQNQDMHWVVQRSLPVRMADPGELSISCLDCHHNTTMPVAALLSRYAAETPFPEAWGGFRCSALLGGPPGGRADNPAVAAGPDAPGSAN